MAILDLARAQEVRRAADYVHEIRREIQFDPRASAFLEDAAPDASLGTKVIFVETTARAVRGEVRALAVVYDARTNLGWQVRHRNAKEHFAAVEAFTRRLAERLDPLDSGLSAVAEALAETDFATAFSQQAIRFTRSGRFPVDVVVLKVPEQAKPGKGPLAEEMLRRGLAEVVEPAALEGMMAERDDPDERVVVTDSRAQRTGPNARPTGRGLWGHPTTAPGMSAKEFLVPSPSPTTANGSASGMQRLAGAARMMERLQAGDDLPGFIWVGRDSAVRMDLPRVPAALVSEARGTLERGKTSRDRIGTVSYGIYEGATAVMIEAPRSTDPLDLLRTAACWSLTLNKGNLILWGGCTADRKWLLGLTA